MTALTDDQIDAAAEVLLDLRAGRRTLVGLPPQLTPDEPADIQRIIDVTSAGLDTDIEGWKTYCLYKPMTPMLCAPIYTVLQSGAVIPADISPFRLIEPEIMFRVERDLPAREHQYDVVEVLEAVTAVVGFEVIGSRFAMGDPTGAPAESAGEGSLYGSLSDHLANGCIVVGDEIPGWRDVAFEDVPLRVTAGDREVISIVGCHPIDNPFLPVVAGVNRLRRRSGVRAGQVIITSSSTSILPVDAGEEVRATYSGLGTVAATFATS